MNKFRYLLFCLLLTITTIHASERQIRAVCVDELGSSTPSECITAKAMVSGTNLRIFLSQTDKWLGIPEYTYPAPLIVRYFDSDGNYLGRFRTSNIFMAKWIADLRDVEIEAEVRHKDYYDMEDVTLISKDTAISYKINARDIAHIGIIELSFDMPEHPAEKYAKKTTKEEYLQRIEDPHHFIELANYKVIESVELLPAEPGFKNKLSGDELKEFARFIYKRYAIDSTDRIHEGKDEVTPNGKEVKVHLITGKEYIYMLGTYRSSHNSIFNEKQILCIPEDEAHYAHVVLSPIDFFKINN